ncbi:MAG: type III-B CRISPR-associated protein Cas10/Cmr2, partial [Vicinamibacterales bacterium]
NANTSHYRAFPYDSQILFADDPDLDPSISKDEIRRLAGSSMPPYFATLVADGDRMGKHLSTLQSLEAHRDFSRRLARFAGQARAIVIDERGVPVYSGGDDVLAFLPVDTAIRCADRLRGSFTEIVGSGLTLSAGISIGHYHDPLHLLLEWGRQAERAAKRSRNALAVVWHTRSGGEEARIVVMSWEADPAARWSDWVEWFARDLVPDGLAYELRSLARELAGLNRDAAESLLPIEARRIIGRKQAERGRRKLDSVTIEAIIHECSSVEKLTQTVDLMLVARRLAAAQRATSESAVRQ